MMEPVGVIGLGVVGGTVASAFRDVGITIRGYDRYLGIGSMEDMRECRVVFMCVPTPNKEDGSYDLSEVWAAATYMEPHLEDGTIVAIKSTVSRHLRRACRCFPQTRVRQCP